MEYDFDPPQLGFRRHQGTEIAILRAISPPTLQDDYIAILDLKQAYPSVRKDKLLELSIGKHAQATSFQTVEDDYKAVGTFNRGVPQGSVTRTSFYNVFMDSFPRGVTVDEPRSNNLLIMFADDIQLRARYREGLQALLNQATNRAVANDMIWNVAKCSIICADPNEGDSLTLAGEVVQEVIQSEYLDVTMAVEVIIHYDCLNRISKAKKRLNQLRLIGLNNTGFHPPTNRRTYITLVRSMTEYQIHLTQ